MLSRLGHIVLICRDIDAGVSAYTKLLGFAPSWRSQDSDFSSAIFTVENTALELLAPRAASPALARIKDILGNRESALTTLAFTAEDIKAAHHTLTRRGLMPGEIANKQDQDLASGNTRKWSSFRCSDAACAGIKTFIIEPQDEPLEFNDPGSGGVQSLDHIVIQTQDPERAIAHYGARLGLRFALDRTIEAFHTRFLFFRIGGLTLEVIQKIDQTPEPSGPDAFWGLTWSTDDLEAAHVRLSKQGLDVSEIRKGRKAGSRVFTLRSGTLGVPTLYISHDKFRR